MTSTPTHSRYEIEELSEDELIAAAQQILERRYERREAVRRWGRFWVDGMEKLNARLVPAN